MTSHIRKIIVNSQIPYEHSCVKYDSIDNVVDLIKKFGKDSLMAKSDIEDAFRIVPIHPSNYHLLGFSWNGKYFFDRCLPMGASSSCKIFEHLSQALVWMMHEKFQASGISHILDDFFFIGPPSSGKCKQDLTNFLFLCSQIGIPIKMEKTVLPCTCLTIYGIEVDSVEMECRLPVEKIDKIKNKLKEVKDRRKVTLKQLQSLIGLLNYACLVVVPGRAFLRRLINLTCHISNPHHFIRLNSAARDDIKMWEQFIGSFNGKSVFLSDLWSTSDSLSMFTDASGTVGYAAILGSNWFAQKWPESLQNYQIAIKELFPIVLAFELWGQTLKNRKVLIRSDNRAVVDILNKKSSKDESMMRLLRRMVLTSLDNNILFRAKHIPGKTNTIADKLSRFQFQEAFQNAPWLSQTQTPIPVHLLRI